jgi:glutamate N-acetyltransferase/amino-acid N-acetyltransferase
MAVNLPPLPELAPVPGIRLATVRAGVRYADRDDLVLFELPPRATVAALFTRNRFRAAPVRIAEQALAALRGHGRSPSHLLINTGNANAGTGPAGEVAAQACCEAVAVAAGVDVLGVLPFSTGVIGEPLPAHRITGAIPEALAALGEEGWARAAGGILTTDTAPKGACVRVDGSAGHVTGIAKGAGMIRPDMATMLAFLATDVAATPTVLDVLLRRAANASFNRITVDGDTSTNDAVVLISTGTGTPIEDLDDPAADALGAAVEEACVRLAQAIVRDGEGATRFVAVDVGGARSAAEALACAYTIAESPLVKTALFAGDPNWGRILAAIGRSGIGDLDVGGVAISLVDDLGAVSIAEAGGVARGYREEDGARVVGREEFTIRVDLGRGNARETVWTTDLSHEYVRINAEYRS